MLYLDKADEIRIDYRPQDETLKEFLQIYKDKHIYITIKDGLFDKTETLKSFKELKNDAEVPNNWTIQVSIRSCIDSDNLTTDKVKIDAIKECCHNFMFIEPAYSWEELYFTLSQGVSDIYIGGELGFSLAKVKKQCKNYGSPRIRTIANVISGIISQNEQEQYHGFFIRPEDVQFYENLIDSIEVYGETQNAQEAEFRAYAITHTWFGNLNELIYDLTVDIDNRGLLQQYGKYRSKCERRCLKGGFCDLCKSMANLSKNLIEAGAVVTPLPKMKKQEQEEIMNSDELEYKSKGE